MTMPERVELTPPEMDELLIRLKNHTLVLDDYETLKGLLNTVSFLDHVLREKKIGGCEVKKTLWDKDGKIFTNTEEN